MSPKCKRAPVATTTDVAVGGNQVARMAVELMAARRSGCRSVCVRPYNSVVLRRGCEFFGGQLERPHLLGWTDSESSPALLVRTAVVSFSKQRCHQTSDRPKGPDTLTVYPRSPLLTGVLIFETILADSATKSYDGLPVRRETRANSDGLEVRRTTKGSAPSGFSTSRFLR